MKAARILISAHDAGGANQVLYKFKTDPTAHFALTGPACKIAESLDIEYDSNFENIDFMSFNRIVVASNSEPQLADEVLKHAQNLKIKTFGFFDHWVNYSNRWSKHPDRFLVSDLNAFIGVLTTFQKIPILTSNSYLKEVVDRYSRQPNNMAKYPLIILQPIDLKESHKHQKCICASLEKIKSISRSEILILRMHYKSLPEECTFHLRTITDMDLVFSDPGTPIEFDLARASIVVGYDSYALFLAKSLGIKVFTLWNFRRSWFAPKYPVLN
jgi:hypothetical protein